MEDFGKWIAESPLGGAFKVAFSASLVWLLDNLASFNVPAVVQVALVAALPVLINWVNPQDPRYGNDKEIADVSYEG